MLVFFFAFFPVKLIFPTSPSAGSFGQPLSHVAGKSLGFQPVSITRSHYNARVPSANYASESSSPMSRFPLEILGRQYARGDGSSHGSDAGLRSNPGTEIPTYAIILVACVGPLVAIWILSAIVGCTCQRNRAEKWAVLPLKREMPYGIGKVRVQYFWGQC